MKTLQAEETASAKALRQETVVVLRKEVFLTWRRKVQNRAEIGKG